MRRVVLPVIVIGLLLSTACGDDAESPGSRSAEGFPLTVQSCDRTVMIDQPPERVVTQGAEAPVFVAAVGAADRIVARNDASGFPFGPYEQVLQDVPVIGDDETGVSTEVILAQTADLVINRGGGSELAAEDAQQFGLDVIVVSGGRVAAVEESSRDTPEGTTAAAIVFANDGSLGGYGQQQTRYIELNNEELINRNPDVLVVMKADIGTVEENVQKVLTRPEFASITAVREGRVVGIPFGLAASSPIAIEGLKQLAEQLSAVR